MRTYAGGRPIRDARHAQLLGRFKAQLHPSLRWRTEVPLPNPSDPRAWDGTVGGDGWLYGVEAEIHPMDVQAVVRRPALKRRDGGVNGLILLLPDTRQARAFRTEFGALVLDDFPGPGRRALELLAAGADPGGSSIVVT